MTQPVPDLFHIHNNDEEVAKILTFFHNAVHELVAFGTHVLAWDLAKPIPDDQAMLSIPLLFRHIVDTYDAISILIKHHAADSCRQLLRSALETHLNLEYMLEDKVYRRAQAYFICELHNKLLVDKSFDPREDRHKTLSNEFRSNATFIKKPPKIPGIDKQIDETLRIIADTKYQEVEREYQKYIKESRKRDVAWYALFDGPKNLFALAQRLKHQEFYDVYYRSWSGPTHGTGLILFPTIRSNEEGFASVAQIRNGQMIQHITSNALCLGLYSIDLMVNKRHKDKLDEYAKWYKYFYSNFFDSILNKKFINDEN